MYNFFCDNDSISGNLIYISGNDFNHIKNVLRLKTEEQILVSCGGNCHLCFIKEFTDDTVIVQITEENYHNTELPIKIHLFQGLPKSDKMELIIQKAVELGAHSITPVEMNRCVVKLDQKKKDAKISRWQAISQSAAKQSKRTLIPKVCDVVSYKEVLDIAAGLDMLLVPYESKDGMDSTAKALSELKSGMSVGILIGPEGGFEEYEIEQAQNFGGKIISLGKRILRTETAAITAVSMCMLHSELEDC